MAQYSEFSFQDGHQRYRWLLASPLMRVFAALLDALLTAVAAAPALWLLHAHFGKGLADAGRDALLAHMGGSPWLMAALSLLLLYGVAQLVLLARCGQSFGKWLTGIRIVRSNGETAGLFHAWLMRSLVFWLACAAVFTVLLKLAGLDDNFALYEVLWIPMVICFAMLFNLHDNNRTLQDKLAGTAVVGGRVKRD